MDERNNTDQRRRTSSSGKTRSSAGRRTSSGSSAGGRTSSGFPAARRTPSGKRPPDPARDAARAERLRKRQAEVRRNRLILGGVLLVLLIIILIIIFSGKKESNTEPSTAETAATAQGTVTPQTPDTSAKTVTTEAKTPTTEAAPSESLQNQIVTKDGKKYYYNWEGNLVKDDLVSYDGILYSADSQGELTTANGWRESNGVTYYAEADGSLHPDETLTIGNVEYRMDSTGAVIDGTPTIDQYLGCKDLYGWMVTHQSDYTNTNFNPMTDYTDTPEMLIRPYSEYGEESHMNCAGFIAHLLKSAGGDLDKVSAMGGRGEYANADNYLKLATDGYVKYSVYNSIEEMLQSGEARKGDILYLQPAWNPGEDCHIGVYWGDTPSEDKFWQQNWDCENAVTNIRMDDPIVKIYRFPIRH